MNDISAEAVERHIAQNPQLQPSTIGLLRKLAGPDKDVLAMTTTREIAELADYHSKVATGSGKLTNKQRNWHLKKSIALRDAATLLAKQVVATTTAEDAREWTSELPTKAGLYRVRGWSIDYPPAEAVVSVCKFKGRLVCNIHTETTNRSLADWRGVAQLTAPTFEWQQIQESTHVA